MIGLSVVEIDNYLEIIQRLHRILVSMRIAITEYVK